MIFRLSQKLSARIKAGTLATLPPDDNPFADWSAGLFQVGRSQYILVSNTKSLYSTVLPGKGVTDEGDFIERALSGIREFLTAEGHGSVYQRFIGPASAEVRFGKALNRSVTASVNELVRHAAAWLAGGDLSQHEVSIRLNDTLLSALARGAASYGTPREAFKELPPPPGSVPRTEGVDAGG